MDPPPPPTPEIELQEYVSLVQRKIVSLEKETKQMLGKLHIQEENMEETRDSITQQSSAVKQDIALVGERLATIMKETAALVAAFKTVVRKAQFERTRQRVDAFRGEQFISRDELRRMIEKEKE